MNLIFDGNFLLHKTRGLFLSYNEHATLTDALREPESKAQFFRKVIIDLCHTINLFNNVDKVIIVFDKDSSWRKTYYPLYKFKEPSDNSDAEGWTAFYGLLDKVSNLLSKRGFIVSSVSGLEGDDLLHLWSQHFSDKEEQSIIITGDRDMIQLTSDFVAIYNNNSMRQTFSFVDEKQKSHLKKLDPKNEEIVDPERFLFKKILIGDSGDGVPNVMKGLGDKTADKIVDLAISYDLLECDFNDPEYVEKVVLFCSTIIKKSDPTLLTENITRNAVLMQLDNWVYPHQLLQEALQQITALEDQYSYQGEFNLSEILTTN